MSSVDYLEARKLLAASVRLAGGQLSMNGSNGDDTSKVEVNGNSVVATLTTPAGTITKTFAASLVSKIVFTGNAGNDQFTNDTAISCDAFGGKGNDTLVGGSAGDRLFGEAGDDYLDGRAGDDYVIGNEGNNVLLGGAGQDFLLGRLRGKATNVMDGGDGADHLVVGFGDVVTTVDPNDNPGIG